MKALSVRQPWAWAIFHAGKDVENRTWATAHRGHLAIHATKPRSRAEYAEDCDDIEAATGKRPPSYDVIVVGALIGDVQLDDCRDGEIDSLWAHDGAVWWLLSGARYFPVPVAAKGRLGLFTVADDLICKHVPGSRLKTQRL